MLWPWHRREGTERIGTNLYLISTKTLKYLLKLFFLRTWENQLKSHHQLREGKEKPLVGDEGQG